MKYILNGARLEPKMGDFFIEFSFDRGNISVGKWNGDRTLVEVLVAKVNFLPPSLIMNFKAPGIHQQVTALRQSVSLVLMENYFFSQGVHWNVFGKSINGHLVLEPDEALYMLDHVRSTSRIKSKNISSNIQRKSCSVNVLPIIRASTPSLTNNKSSGIRQEQN